MLMDRWKSVYAQKTDKRKLADVIAGADIFLGLSAPAVLKPEMVKEMAAQPLIMALANPTPEIMPEEALKARPDALICTGRSDYPNQVNNVLCFPYIFRGALDVGATEINEAMKIAAVEAIAALAREAPSEVAARAYGGEAPTFGPGSLIPNPVRSPADPADRAGARGSRDGIGRRDPADRRHGGLSRAAQRVRVPLGLHHEAAVRPGQEPIPSAIVYAEGEDERVLRATQVVVEEGLAKPILIGRPAVIEARLERFGLAIRPERDFVLINPQEDPRYRKYVDLYIEAAGRRGVTPDAARTVVRTNSTVIAAAMVRAGDADAALCGVEGGYMGHLRHIRDLIGTCPGVDDFAALSLLITGKGNIFLADTQVRTDPSAEGIAEVAVLAAAHIRRFGIEPRIALVSHSDFGSYDSATARKMRAATALLWERKVDFEVDGEMHADSALDPRQRERVYPHSRLTGRGQCADPADARCGEHRLRVDQDDGRCARGRADPDRHGEARAYPHAIGDRARHRQHDRSRGGRGPGLRGVAGRAIPMACTWLGRCRYPPPSSPGLSRRPR